MITAIVLLKAEVHSIPETGQAIAELAAVSEVYSVAGPWDLVAVVRVRSQEELADAITHQIDKIPGITSSETLLGLQVFSRHDLDRMFSLGYESETQ
ncbi:MAG TPA: Lrp/AsnC ligand binding domain-containing protein [Actinomycetota bacterium]|nr:Lrp/AsnC ligand binding domain-containing protein [Actinomycetota bacterium]